MTELPIRATGLAKTYRIGFALNRRVNALRGLDLQVERSSIYGLLGPNGAGKSTTIKILLNLVQASAGSATLFGRPVSNREARRRVGYVPENPAPYEYLTGLEFVRLCGRVLGLSGADLDAQCTSTLDRVGLSRAKHLQIRRYSKGMIQRVALAQALLGSPELLILDEPTSGLDPVGRREMRDIILETRDRGVTILFCTHIIPDVEALCDRLVVLVAGRAVQEGSVRELVSTGGSVVEVISEGGEPGVLDGLPVQSQRRVGDRTVWQVSEAAVNDLLRKLLARGAQILQVQAARFTLEDLFMKTLAEANAPRVGSEID